ncbi:23S rRNA (adenine(1618)-N(6))-methyltransferase RlmF [Methylobacillus gramineus]|uniref:23S rRNA (adenine(1618)-N(6))-methyltransferase RlmF n=1 Tax=Methylobacillus gramineus TaxID=755169 RepID=UPI001CFFA8B2|nr:23S rRNA (adenine(1618)-N(6))-methyltransferase RlmF [Methylobacillus gramineus]MCB5185553.1 23S rRNA (adenine(1618)-N(6))-methyltransferase RlmF [Methylobacillus gramineus]
MTAHTPSNPVEKSGLHPRNQHRARYDFEQLTRAHPVLANFVRLNEYQDASINFADPLAVKALNQALLKHYYAIAEWDIPAQFLCPPIPGRADYLHYLADLLAASNGGFIPRGRQIQVLDIGVGANLVYPLIGQHEYGWQFVGADINPQALDNARQIVAANPGLDHAITLRLQANAAVIFPGVVEATDRFDLTMCNPPFHASQDDAAAGTQRKWQGLEKSRGKPARRSSKPLPAHKLNFGGQSAELYCEGGEEAFIDRMVSESAAIGRQCLWFTTLVSKATTLPAVYRVLRQADAFKVKTIDMAQGQKKSRVVAWTFLDSQQQRAWVSQRWPTATSR